MGVYRGNTFSMCKLIGVLVLNLIFSASVFAKEDQKTITFGIVPQQAASKLARVWSPILQYLSEQTGQKVLFRTAPDIPTFEQRVAEGLYDVAYMNPYHYTVFHDNPGYLAFAKAKNKKLQGIIVVRKDSKVENLQGLNGEKLAFPAPAAFAASVLPQAHLHEAGVQFGPKYVSSHDSVYRSVAQGLFSAGGGVKRTFKSVDAEVRDQLRILWTTPAYTSHAIAAHPRVPKKVVETIQTALIALSETAHGKALVRGLKVEGFEAATDRLWDDVRGLKLKTPIGVKQ